MKAIYWLMAVMLVMAGIVPALAESQTRDTTKAILVNYHYKDGKYTYVSSRVVYGYPPNNLGNSDMQVDLLGDKDAVIVSYGVADPRVLYHEDGADILDEVDFTVILPFNSGAETVNVYEGVNRTLAASTDIGDTISSFCAQNPNDPECGGGPGPTGAPLSIAVVVISIGAGMLLLGRR